VAVALRASDPGCQGMSLRTLHPRVPQARRLRAE
jgi:hypothetical protein